MTNHVHLLVTPCEVGAVGAMMQDVGRRYVRVINTLHARTGSLWEGRFKSSLVDSENYLLNCHRYIEQNPVRAGMVGHPADYPWSSHGHYGKPRCSARTNALVTEHAVFRQLGMNDHERRAAFDSLCAELLEKRVVEKIREAINTDSAIGSEQFMDFAESQLGRSVRPPKRGRPQKVVTGKLL